MVIKMVKVKKNEIFVTDDEEEYIKKVLEWWNKIPDERYSMEGTWDYEAYKGMSRDEWVHHGLFIRGMMNLILTWVVVAAIFLTMYYLYTIGVLK